MDRHRYSEKREQEQRREEAARPEPEKPLCRFCQFENDFDAKYCEECRKPLDPTVDPSQSAFARAERTVVLQNPSTDRAVQNEKDSDALLEEIERYAPGGQKVEAPPPIVVPDDVLRGTEDDHKLRFNSRKDEIQAILAKFEERLAMDRLGSGLNVDPKIRLWRCNHESGFHFGPQQCAQPGKGGHWEWLSLAEFKKMKWYREAP